MSTMAILVLFGLMLFLPCGIALMRSRENDDDPYAEYVETPGMQAEAWVQEMVDSTPEPELVEESDAVRLELLAEGDVSDPLSPGHLVRGEDRTELDMLRTRARAARLEAEALAMAANAAEMRADAADAAATLLEQELVQALREVRRAA